MQRSTMSCDSLCRRSPLTHNAQHSSSYNDPAAGVSLSPVQSQRLDVPSDSVDPAAGVPLSPVQFQLLTCAAGYQRAAVDAPLAPV